MATFVLVHGTSCGRWIWKRLSPLLRAAGHEVYTPTLAGLGETSHLLPNLGRITLATHIEDVTSLLHYEDLSDVILVGNSYSGMVITGVAAKEPRRLAHLVYLDAYVPSEGENEMQLWPPEARAQVEEEIRKGGVFRPLPPDFPAFLGVTDPQVAEWAQARFTPHPLSTYEDAPPPNTQESASIPKTFILCKREPPTSTKPHFDVFAAKARSLGWSVKELDAGHAAMLTNPSELADILLETANTWGGDFRSEVPATADFNPDF